MITLNDLLSNIHFKSDIDYYWFKKLMRIKYYDIALQWRSYSDCKYIGYYLKCIKREVA